MGKTRIISSATEAARDAQARVAEIFAQAADDLRDVADAYALHEIKTTNTQLNAELLDAFASNPWGGTVMITELRALLGHYETPKNIVY